MKTVKLNNVSKKYKDKVVLDNVNISFKTGNSYMLVGYNGAGKTTLLKIIIGLITPTKGEVEKKEIKIGYVPEKYILPEYIKVKDYLMVLGKLRKIPYSKLCSIIDSNLKEWGLYEYRDYKVKQLSKGMIQKIVLIQCFFHEPDLYIFDEALNGLDIKMQEKLLKKIGDLKKQKKIVIITSHYPKLYEEYIDIIYLIENAKVRKIDKEEC